VHEVWTARSFDNVIERSPHGVKVRWDLRVHRRIGIIRTKQAFRKFAFHFLLSSKRRTLVFRILSGGTDVWYQVFLFPSRGKPVLRFVEREREALHFVGKHQSIS
jgi:hypothetical protein